MNRVRPATFDDIERVHSTALAEYIDMCNGKVLVLEVDGQPAALAGVTPVGEFLGGFAQWRPGRKPGARGIMRLARAWVDLARSQKVEITALAEPDEPRSAALLQHLGFVHENENVWKWPCPSS